MADTPITSAEATTRLTAARTALASAEATLKGLLVDKATAQEWADRAALMALRPRVMDAEDNLGIAQAAVPIAEAALAAALAREEQARRQAAYDTAVAALAAGEEARIVEYPSLAHRIREIIRMQAEVDITVERVNAALPDGAVPLQTLFQRYAGWAGLPLQDLDSTEVELWVSDALDHIVDSQNQFQDLGNRTGKLGEMRVHKKRFRRIKFLRATSGRSYDGFANVLSLPGLPEEPAYYTPAHSDEPTAVLAHLSELEGRETTHQPPTRRPEYRYEPIEDDKPAAA